MLYTADIRSALVVRGLANILGSDLNGVVTRKRV